MHIYIHFAGLRREMWIAVGALLFILMLICYKTSIYSHNAIELNRSRSPLPLLANREELVVILHNENFKTGAEVGVQRGLYSEHLLSKWPGCIEYHVIDLWAQQENYYDGANVKNEVQDSYYAETRERLKKWEKIVHYHRNYSSVAVKYLKDESMDFIYIDARRDYTGVAEDIQIYWPKLKYGGVFAGHDFVDAPKEGEQDFAVDRHGVRKENGKAVKSAVMEFAAKHNRQLLQTLQDWPSWYFRK